MFTLHAFVPPTVGELTLQTLSERFQSLLSGVEPSGLSVDQATHPFTKREYLVSRWPQWGFTVHLEAGTDVASDAKFVQSVAAGAFQEGLPDRRVRLVFGDDPMMDFTNHILWVVDELRTIPGVFVYDEKQKGEWP